MWTASTEGEPSFDVAGRTAVAGWCCFRVWVSQFRTLSWLRAFGDPYRVGTDEAVCFSARAVCSDEKCWMWKWWLVDIRSAGGQFSDSLSVGWWMIFWDTFHWFPVLCLLIRSQASSWIWQDSLSFYEADTITDNLKSKFGNTADIDFDSNSYFHVTSTIDFH